MIPIYDFESKWRKNNCDRCRETSCFLNKLFVPEQAIPTRLGIPTEKCINILVFISNNASDVRERAWMEALFLENKFMPYPFQLTKSKEGQGMEYSGPLSIVQWHENISEGPANLINERMQELLKNVLWDVG